MDIKVQKAYEQDSIVKLILRIFLKEENHEIIVDGEEIGDADITYIVNTTLCIPMNKFKSTKNNSIDIMKCKLNDNLSKKLKQFEGEEFLEEPIDFIDSIEIINRKPAKYSYKNVTLLGNKLNIKVKSDELSQKKALMAIALGLGEKGSSLGAGFCNYI